MAASGTARSEPATSAAADPRGGRRRERRIRNFLRRQPIGALTGGMLVAMILAAVFAPQLAPYAPNEQFATMAYASPSDEFLLGTDQFGRDTLSRILYGARISLFIGFAATAVGASLGAAIGIVSGYFGGIIDLIAQRIVDTLQAFPPLVLAITLVVALGPSQTSVVLAVGATTIPLASRVVRSVALQVRSLEYITSSRAAGAPTSRILFRHVLPQAVAPIIVVFSVRVGHAIVTEATLGFLGLGVPPPAPTWGQMLSQSMSALYISPWTSIFPGVALCLTVFVLNIFGDVLRDEFDPSLRGSRP